MFQEDSDSDIEINTRNEYAKNYDIWRRKEELNKFKTKYGEELLEEDSTSSDDDEEGVELTEEVEKQFFKTLSCLKNKDPRIYDGNVNFFENSGEQISKKKTKKEKPLYINDYEREMLLKTNGKFSDSDEKEEEEKPRSVSPTYVEEQKKIKESFKHVLNEINDDDDGELGGILKVRNKTEEEKQKEEAEYMEWLAGQKEEIDDKEAEADLKPLKDYWNNPDLDEGEKFLRDYILKKKFLSNEDEDYIPTYEEIIHDSDKDLSEDENAIEQQQEFEHKYNFRFEEPDQEFIKRYPRTVEQSLRRTDDKRKVKRAETKERKQKEKEEKMQELKKLQELKRKEIEDKIQQLREITGNDDIEFKNEDLEGDFDPEAHDKKMQSLFNEQFYEGTEENEKPVFPEIDDYLDIENWEQWQGAENGKVENSEDGPHCDDEDFNMDCDYDPMMAVKEELIENSKGRKKRKRKSLFAKAVSEPKPVFDPNDKTYEQYLDEYYKLDCEDIIGDTPCRFKYRKVVANDFGLTVEEILTAKDRELNKWCSLKKAIQHRPDHVEKYDQVAYSKKANNIELKKRILPSLFESEKSDEREKTEEIEQIGQKKKKKVKKIICKKGVVEEENGEVDKSTEQQQSDKSEHTDKKKKKKKQKQVEVAGRMDHEVTNADDSGSQNKQNKKKKKKKKKNKQGQNNNSALESSKEETKVSKKRKLSTISSGDGVPKKKTKKEFKQKNTVPISDARLSAYGINPKKFKNKIKYGKS